MNDRLETTVNALNGIHFLTPTGVYVLLILAFVIDYTSIGPNSIRDRVAFFIAVACINEGFNASTLDAKLAETLGAVIDQTKVWSGDAYIADAKTNIVIGAVVSIAWIFTIGVLLPAKFSSRVGKFATMTFECKTRLNYKLWASAIFLGLMTDLTQGLFGFVFQGALRYDTFIVGFLPRILFGA
jgi:hypothetical protein